jgi:hypothetical protein
MTQVMTIPGYNGTIKHELLAADLRTRMSWQVKRDFDLRDAELVHLAKALGADRTQLSVHNPHADELAHYSLQAFRGTECVLDVPYA